MNMQTIKLQLEMLSGSNRIGADHSRPQTSRRNSNLHHARSRNAMAMSWMLLGLSILSAVLIVLGAEGERRGIPELWMHGLIALVIGQFAVAVGASLKAKKPISRGTRLVADRRNPRATIRNADSRAEFVSPPRLPPILTLAPAVPTRLEKAKGKIGERIFIEYSDGSIEVDTLLGRRLFPTLEMAQEFIGGVATRVSVETVDSTMLAA